MHFMPKIVNIAWQCLQISFLKGVFCLNGVVAVIVPGVTILVTLYSVVYKM
jgi:hypothetical protein